jgi:phosphocarrier protein
MELKKEIEIKNEAGLHARPAAQFVQKAGNFKSEINIIFEDKEINAKSIMSLLSLGISKGKKITLIAEGEDESTAIKELVKYIEVEMPKENN